MQPFFPSLDPEAPSIVTADRVIHVDSDSVIRMVAFVGEVVPTGLGYQAHTVPAADVAENRVEPGALAPEGYGWVPNPFTGV